MPAAYGDSTVAFGSATVAVPSGNTGDILCAITFDISAAPAGGWTQRASVAYDVTTYRVWTKTRTGSEGASYAWTTDTGIFPIVSVVNITGAIENPTIATPTTGTSTTATGPNITAPAAGGLLVFSPLNVSDVNFNSTPSGMTERENEGPEFFEVWTQALSGGASGQRSVTLSASGNWAVAAAIFESTGFSPSAYQPTADQQCVSLNSTIGLTFAENIQANTGNVVITNVTDSTTIETIAITNTGQVVFSGATVTITPSSALPANKVISVAVDSGAIVRASDSEPWTGGSWQFNTYSVAWIATGAPAYSASGGASVAPPYPSGLASGDKLVLVVGQKPSSANGGTCTTPTDWDRGTEITGATDGDTGGYGATLGADTGNCNLYTFSKTATGSESGTLSVTIGTNNVSWGVIHLLRKRADLAWSALAGTTGKRTSAPSGSVSVAMSSDPGVQAADVCLSMMVVPTDVNGATTWSAQGLSQTGITYGTVSEADEPNSGTGNDIGGWLAYGRADSGTSSSVPTLTATKGGTTTNSRGPLVFLRVRAEASSSAAPVPLPVLAFGANF